MLKCLVETRKEILKKVENSNYLATVSIFNLLSKLTYLRKYDFMFKLIDLSIKKIVHRLYSRNIK